MEHKYIKYKIKYLKLKNSQVGGKKMKFKTNNNKSVSHNYMEHLKLKYDIEDITKIGAGWNGVVYRIKKNDEFMILKFEKMDKYDKLNNLTSEYYRQVDFNNVIAKYHKDKFMYLDSHGIIENCEFEHPNTKDVLEKGNETRKLRFIRKNAEPNCYYLIYKPLLDGTFTDIKNEIKNDKIKLFDFMIQIINSINIYRKKGFIHTDINADNFMYKKDNDKYKWYIIDYGNITNINYPDSLLDIERINGNPNYKKLLVYDLIHFIERFCISNNFPSFKNKQERDEFINKIKTDKKYKDIIKYVPKTIIKTSSGIIDFYTQLITKIKYPNTYAKYIGVEIENVKKQLLVDKLLLCIKYSNNKNYNKLIKLLLD
jgi:hypothetical protein